MKEEYQEIVDELAEKHGVDPDTLLIPEYKMDALYKISEEALRKNLDRAIKMMSDHDCEECE